MLPHSVTFIPFVICRQQRPLRDVMSRLGALKGRNLIANWSDGADLSYYIPCDARKCLILCLDGDITERLHLWGQVAFLHP